MTVLIHPSHRADARAVRLVNLEPPQAATLEKRA
jgi:hypothetical protein